MLETLEVEELEEPEEPEDLSEVEQMIKDMEDDATLIEVSEPRKDPHSSAYNATDLFNSENINSKHPCTKRKCATTTPKEELKSALKKALWDSGFTNDQVEKMIEGKEINEEMSKAYGDLVKEIMKSKRESPDYEEGRWPKIDKI